MPVCSIGFVLLREKENESDKTELSNKILIFSSYSLFLIDLTRLHFRNNADFASQTLELKIIIINNIYSLIYKQLLIRPCQINKYLKILDTNQFSGVLSSLINRTRKKRRGD